MSQRFYAHPTDTFISRNGAVGHRSGSSFDCLGPYAKVSNCPVIVDDSEVARLTCYATGHADTYFSIPACTQYRRTHVRGYFTSSEDHGGTVFRVMDSHKHLFT